MNKLPIIENCNSCGACCQLTPVPPFQPGEDIMKDVPDELMQPSRDRVAADQHFDRLACVWYDPELAQCRHYDLRPDACRKFEINSDLCHGARWDVGVDL
jgi:uncharacterized protein